MKTFTQDIQTFPASALPDAKNPKPVLCFSKLHWLHIVDLVLTALLAASMVAGSETLTTGETESTPSKQANPWSSLGAKATIQHTDDGLAVSTAADGPVRLCCTFQRLEGLATDEGLWLTSTVEGAKNDRFQVVADYLSRDGGAMVALPERGVTVAEPKLAPYVRRGLVEECSVSVAGVRQNVVVSEPPGDAGPLRVEMGTDVPLPLCFVSLICTVKAFARRRQSPWRYAPAHVTLFTFLLVAGGESFAFRSAAQSRITFEQGHTAEITSLAYSPDGKWAVTGGADGQAISWDIFDQPGQRKQNYVFWSPGVYPSETRIRVMAEFSPDGCQVLAAKYTQVIIWSPNSGWLYFTVGATQLFRRDDAAHLRDFTHYFTDSAWRLNPRGKGCLYAHFLPSSDEIFTAQRWGALDNWQGVEPIRFRNSATEDFPVTAYLPTSRPMPTDMTWDGNLLVGITLNTGDPRNTVNYATLVNSQTGVEKHPFSDATYNHSKRVTDAKFSPDGRLVVTVSEDRTARLWETATGSYRTNYCWHNEAINSVAFSPTGDMFVTGSDDGKAVLWSLNGCFPITVLEHEIGAKVKCVAFSPLGDTILTSVGSIVYLWHDFWVTPSRYELVLRIEGAGSVVASPPPGYDGKYVEGTRVRLAATPSTGYRFNRWTWDASSRNPDLDVILDSNKVMVASFVSDTTPPEISSVVLNGRQISVEWVGGGTLERADSICGPWFSTGDNDGIHQVEAVGPMQFFRVVR